MQTIFKKTEFFFNCPYTGTRLQKAWKIEEKKNHHDSTTLTKPYFLYILFFYI